MKLPHHVLSNMLEGNDESLLMTFASSTQCFALQAIPYYSPTLELNATFGMNINTQTAEPYLPK